MIDFQMNFIRFAKEFYWFPLISQGLGKEFNRFLKDPEEFVKELDRFWIEFERKVSGTQLISNWFAKDLLRF